MEISGLIFLECLENSYFADARCPQDCGCDDGGCVER